MEKIFFVISYLRGIALDYFEPFINEPDPLQNFDFLEDWSAFVQKLSNVFGSYTPEDNDENAIIAIPFPPDGKAITYFIQFAKYQNRICWATVPYGRLSKTLFHQGLVKSSVTVKKTSLPSKVSRELS